MTTRSMTVFMLALACGLAAPQANAEPSRTVNELGPLKVGQPCPSFGGFTLENQSLSLAKLLNPSKGEPANAIVVSFFATWCKPCKAQLPVIERVAASLKDKGVRGVLVDYGEEPEVAAPFVATQKLALPVIPDKFTKIATRLGVDQTLPRTLVVNRRGNVSAIFEHEGGDFEKVLRTALEKAMQEK